jgi:putative DNA primase/helicase
MVRGVANRNTYNPVTDWLNSVPWDGRDHITALLQCLTLDPDEDAVMAEMLFRKWLRGAVAIGTGRTRKMEYVLTLVDPKGGTGKTRFFSSLCPPELRKDGVILDAANKDSLKIATSYWLIELGELDGTFNRSERGKLKAFLSEEVDEIRLPYARAYTKYPRRTAFFASVNDEKFLVDDSGNRRFWPIRVTAVNHEHGLNMQQVWAQVLDEVNRGAGWYLTPGENDAVAIRNEDFKTCSRVVEALDGLYAGHTCGECEKHMSRKELLDAAGVFHASGSDLKEAGNWAKRKGFLAHKRNGKRGFMMPEFVATGTTAQSTTTARAFAPTILEGGKK